jgi:hypothetical protein
MTAPAAFAQPDAGWTRPATEGTAGQIATEVVETVRHAAANAPRSLQTQVGPSQLGTPCTRRLGYSILDWPAKPNSDTDPWTSVIGTAVHAWMAAAYEQKNADEMAWVPEYYGAQNEQLGRERYLVEQRVYLPGGITGSCDLFDRDIGAVIDWKNTSPAQIRDYRRAGPGDQYRTQIHLYGLGMQLAGEQVRDVAIVFLPRGGRVDCLHVWAEPYNPAVAISALKRHQTVREFLWTLDPEQNPGRWAWLPTADAHCNWCPFHLPSSADLSQGCPGHKTGTPRNTIREK